MPAASYIQQSEDQLLHILEVIVIPEYAFPVVHNPVFLVSLKAVQQLLHAVSPDEQRKPIGLDFAEQPLFAVPVTLKAVRNVFLQSAFSILTPVLIRTLS